MEISSKELREVEFRERLRGYDTTEVDEFLERVAIGVDELHGKLRDIADRAERAERPPRDRVATEDDDTLRRTLVLAQRTADMAIREAQDEAAQLLERARGESESILDNAAEAARRMASDAQRQLQAEVERLTTQRDQLRADVRTLSDLLDNERDRLTEALTSALRWVERSLMAPPELTSHRAAPLSKEGADAGDDVHAQVEEDAASAVPRPLGPAREQRPAALPVGADDDADLDDDEEDGPAPETPARLRSEPARLATPAPVLRDTQVWQLDEATQDASWGA